MLEWLIYSLPWWVKLIGLGVIGASGIVILSLIFGFERVRAWIAPLAVLIGAIALANRWQQQGYDARAKKEKDNANKALDRAADARIEAERHRQQHPERLRDDDGFRRDD